MKQIPCRRIVTAVLLMLAGGSLVNAATTIWAGTQGGVHKSIDSGATWQPVTVSVNNPLLQGTSPPTPSVTAIALDPHQPSTIYFVGQMQGSNAFGFYRSTDNGRTWSAVVLIGIPISIPTAFQTTWILVDPVFTNIVYLGWIGGVSKSTDYGVTWSRLTLPTLPNTGGAAATPDGLSVNPNAAGVLYMSTQHYVFKSSDFGSTWTMLAPVVASHSGLRLGNVVADPKNSDVLYVGNSGAGSPQCGPPNARQLCGLFRSADGGQSWREVAPVGMYFEVVFDSRNNDLYASGALAGLGVSVLKSIDGGNTWNPISNRVQPHLVADPGTAAQLYGYQWGNNAWFRSTDGGVSFTTGFIVLTGLNRAVNALAVPRTLGNVSAASFQSGPVAPESIVSALGFDLATVTLAAASQPAPTELGGTTVTIVDADGTSRPAPLFYVSPGQVNYEIPAGTVPGVASVIVRNAAGVVSKGPLGITPVAPALFTLNASGLAAAYALRVSGGNQTYENVYQVDASGAVVARPIDLGPAGDEVYLLLYGTGLRGASDASVTVGGVSVPVLFAGPQGQFAGEDQVNIGPLPRSLAAGGSVAVIFTAAGKTANTVNVTFR